MRKLLLSLLAAVAVVSACKPKNYTVIISLDGSRWDYPDYYEMPFFDSLATVGVKARMEPSFPSSHSLLALVICGTGMMQADRRLKGSPYKGIAIDVLGILMIVTVLCRLLSGVHWFTDILGGILISVTLLSLYEEVISHGK